MADVNELAEALALTPQHIARLVHLGMPRAERGSYPLGACMAWYIRYLQQALERRGSAADGSVTALVAQRTLQSRMRTSRERLELDRERLELVPIDVLRSQLGIAWLEACTVLRALRVPGHDEQVALEVDTALDRLSERLAKIGGRKLRTPSRARSGRA